MASLRLRDHTINQDRYPLAGLNRGGVSAWDAGGLSVGQATARPVPLSPTGFGRWWKRCRDVAPSIAVSRVQFLLLRSVH